MKLEGNQSKRYFPPANKWNVKKHASQKISFSLTFKLHIDARHAHDIHTGGSCDIMWHHVTYLDLFVTREEGQVGREGEVHSPSRIGKPVGGLPLGSGWEVAELHPAPQGLWCLQCHLHSNIWISQWGGLGILNWSIREHEYLNQPISLTYFSGDSEGKQSHLCRLLQQNPRTDCRRIRRKDV